MTGGGGLRARILNALRSVPNLSIVYRAAFELKTGTAKAIVGRTGIPWEEAKDLIQKLESLCLIKSIPNHLGLFGIGDLGHLTDVFEKEAAQYTQYYLTADGFCYAHLINDPLVKQIEGISANLTRVEMQVLHALKVHGGLSLLYEAALSLLPELGRKNAKELVAYSGQEWNVATLLLDKLVELGLLYCSELRPPKKEDWSYGLTQKARNCEKLLKLIP
jgi:hypothetical protein